MRVWMNSDSRSGKYCLENEDGQETLLNDTSLIALWQVRIEFSPLTASAFFKN